MEFDAANITVGVSCHCCCLFVVLLLVVVIIEFFVGLRVLFLLGLWIDPMELLPLKMKMELSM